MLYLRTYFHYIILWFLFPVKEIYLAYIGIYISKFSNEKNYFKALMSTIKTYFYRRKRIKMAE